MKKKRPVKMSEKTAGQLIQELSTAGRYPHPDLINEIWERRAETEPLLLALFDEAYDDDWADDEDPRWYRLVHAGKFMLSWQNPEALPTFGRLYQTDEERIDWREWFEEDLVHYGSAVIPYLEPIIRADSGEAWDYGQGLSISILTQIATYYPETRDQVIAIFRSLLPSPDSLSQNRDELWGDLAMGLAELQDEGSQEQILALDDADALVGDIFYRPYYLREMNRDFEPKTPLPPYDLRDEYKGMYNAEQARLARVAREKERERQSRIQPATRRTGPKIGRNDPCPCGSGKKYKKCCGRPGA